MIQEKIKVATAQFENRSGDKTYNLSMIDKLSGEASTSGCTGDCFSRMQYNRIHLCPPLIKRTDAGHR